MTEVKPKRRRRPRPQTSVKQILTRNHNWKMGNLRRVLMNATALTFWRRRQMEEAVEHEMKEAQILHEKRLWAIHEDNIDTAEASILMAEDEVLAGAIREAQINTQTAALIEMHKVDEEIMSTMSQEERDAYMYGR